MIDSILNIQSRYKYSAVILKQLVITDFKLRYKGSVLGYVWTLLKPLAMFAVMYVVFVQFLKFGENVPHFAVALLLGTVLWNFFSEVTLNGMTSIIGKGDLMRKLSFPRYVLVLASGLSALINLTINLAVVAVFIVLNGVDLTPRAILIAPIIVELFILGISVAFLLATITVRLRDVGYIWELVLQVGFYVTPIFYPLSLIEEKASSLVAHIMLLNPMAQIIQDARFALISPATPTIWSTISNPYIMAIPVVFVIVLLFISTRYFKARAPYFAENV